MENIALGKKSVKTFSLNDLKTELEAQGLDVRKVGRELKFKVDGDSYVLNPGKGVWIGSAGAGTIASLLHRLKIHTSNLPLAPRDKDADEEARKFAEMQRRIKGKLMDSRPLREIGEDSPGTERFSKKIVSDYFVSRGLPLDLLPEDARIRKDEKGFWELVLPLSDNENALSVHVTAIDTNGKHGLDWTGGDCKYTFGPISGQFSFLDGAKEQLRVNEKEGVDWIAIAEGLETSMSIRLLTGWTTVFAVNAGNFEKIFTEEMAKNMIREGKGLAISVDRDESGAGQKAAGKLASLAKETGIPVLFLVPPAVVKGSEKGADWNDALKELNKDGAFGALKVAIMRSEEELEKVESGPSLKNLGVFDADEEVTRAEKISLSEAESLVFSALKEETKESGSLVGLAVPPGVGKSTKIAERARDGACFGKQPLRIFTPTKDLAMEAAEKSGGFFRQGRAGEENSVSWCRKFENVIPYSEAQRSIALLQCADCSFGLAAMQQIRGESPSDSPCEFILHVQQSRTEPVVTAPVALLEGDPTIGTVSVGENKIKALSVFDDVAEAAGLSSRPVMIDDVTRWIRAARVSLSSDKKKMEGINEDKERTARIAATEAMIPELERFSRFMLDNNGDQQIRLSPDEWQDFVKCAKAPALKWLDGTSAETVFRDSEGKTEIPLRAIRALADALARGTVWVKKSVLFFANKTEMVKKIEKGAIVADATLDFTIRKIIEAKGGKIIDVVVEQPTLNVRLFPQSGHGKMTCLPDAPSCEKEKRDLLSEIRKAVGAGKKVAVLTHKAFAEKIESEVPEGVKVGWWGRHDRGHNDWLDRDHLIIWGVTRLSPDAAARYYQACRITALECGCDPSEWPEWNGSQEEKLYRIPGLRKGIRATGYENPKIDQFFQEWTTARLVQGIGRLRAVRRTEPLTVDVHSNFPFSESHGLEFHEIARTENRTMGEYQAGRRESAKERGMIAAEIAGREAGRRKVNEVLIKLGLETISPNLWSEIGSGIRQDIDLLSSNTTPQTTQDFFGKDVDLLVSKLEEWAKAVDPRELVEMTDLDDGTEGWLPVEVAGLRVLHAVFRDPSASGGLPDPVPLPAVG